MHYKNFPKYVLRTPLLPLTFFFALTRNKELTTQNLKEVVNNKMIKEALFLASPSFYTAFEKWLKEDIEDESSNERMKHSILKYLSRMSSRCTPFGLFAGTAVGSFDTTTNIELNIAAQNKRHTRLDMNYLVALSQDLIKDKTVREQLLFYPNTSIYKAGSQLRYVEYNYVNSRRIHHIVGVHHSEYLKKVLNTAVKGASLKRLSESLVSDEITIDVATGFVEELVSSQLLVSELEPSVSGPEFMDQLVPILKRCNGTETLVQKLKHIEVNIHKLDDTIGNNTDHYKSISHSLDSLGTGFELKYLFQTDMSITPKKNTVNQDFLAKVRRAMRLINKISLEPQTTLLTQFKEAFQERYEDREVPLSQALDVELGIGFLQDKDSGDVSPLVDDLILPGKRSVTNTYKETKRNAIQIILHKKLLASIQAQEEEIVLSDSDFEHFEENWNDLPDTISTMIQIVNKEGKKQLIMSSAGGSSAANLLGRFCHSDSEIEAYVKEIVAIEKQSNPDQLLAEIVHLPESRVGNILMRPVLREYEIPYLAKSILPIEKQLPLEDLMISIVKDRIFLRSKKYDKEVLPYLSNAHNYSNGALPIYQFLANMQSQQKRKGIGFYWGPFEGDFSFLPRVVYKDVIIALKTWNLRRDDVQPLQECLKDVLLFEKRLQEFISKRKMPQYVLLVESDNELLVNMKNSTSVKMFLATIKQYSKCTLKEFLHSDTGVVYRGDDVFTNQIIISFYNEAKLKKNTHG